MMAAVVAGLTVFLLLDLPTMDTADVRRSKRSVATAAGSLAAAGNNNNNNGVSVATDGNKSSNRGSVSSAVANGNGVAISSGGNGGNNRMSVASSNYGDNFGNDYGEDISNEEKKSNKNKKKRKKKKKKKKKKSKRYRNCNIQSMAQTEGDCEADGIPCSEHPCCKEQKDGNFLCGKSLQDAARRGFRSLKNPIAGPGAVAAVGAGGGGGNAVGNMAQQMHQQNMQNVMNMQQQIQQKVMQNMPGRR